MNTEQDYLVTYKFYDHRKRRLGIFGVPIVAFGEFEEGSTQKIPTHLRVVVFTCSKKDIFSKQRVRKYFEIYTTRSEEQAPEMLKPFDFIIPIEDNKPKQTFLNYCEQNYFKPYPVLQGIFCDVLVKGDEVGATISVSSPFDLDINDQFALSSEGDQQN